MALSEFYSNGPYVHSHLFNFRKNIYDAFSSNQELGAEYFKPTIEKLQRLSAEMQKAAEAFLDGKDEKQVSKELFFSKETYSGIAMKILRSQGFLEVVAYHNPID